MSEYCSREAFDKVIGDTQFDEFDVPQQHETVTGQAARLQDALEDLLVEYSRGNQDEESNNQHLARIKERLKSELSASDQLKMNDVIFTQGDAFALCADQNLNLVNKEQLNATTHLHGMINGFLVMKVPVFIQNDRRILESSAVTSPMQTGVVLDLALPGIEFTRNGEIHFDDLEYDHVLLPLVYTKDGMQLKRRIVKL